MVDMVHWWMTEYKAIFTLVDYNGDEMKNLSDVHSSTLCEDLRAHLCQNMDFRKGWRSCWKTNSAKNRGMLVLHILC